MPEIGRDLGIAPLFDPVGDPAGALNPDQPRCKTDEAIRKMAAKGPAPAPAPYQVEMIRGSKRDETKFEENK